MVVLVALRSTNLYGEPVPWAVQADILHSVMSFLNFTKYPPSLAFIPLTLGCGMLVLAWLERRDTPLTRVAAVFGGAPLFYYLLHLYLLLMLGKLWREVSAVWQVWLAATLVALVLYWPTRWFGHYKRTSGKAWVKYL